MQGKMAKQDSQIIARTCTELIQWSNGALFYSAQAWKGHMKPDSQKSSWNVQNYIYTGKPEAFWKLWCYGLMEKKWNSATVAKNMLRKKKRRNTLANFKLSRTFCCSIKCNLVRWAQIFVHSCLCLMCSDPVQHLDGLWLVSVPHVL